MYIDTALIERALRFYTQSPDGQYDHDVVVPLLEAELARREKSLNESFTDWNGTVYKHYKEQP